MNRDDVLNALRAHKAILSRRFGVAERALFGPFARAQAVDKSDVDILVRFDRAVHRRKPVAAPPAGGGRERRTHRQHRRRQARLRRQAGLRRHDPGAPQDRRRAESGQIQVRINDADVFHPNTGEIRSDNADGIACWFVDTDYSEESFFVRHAYFLGANDPCKALKTTLKAEINEEAWSTLRSDTSRPFAKPQSGRIAVKVINCLGDEVMKVFRVCEGCGVCKYRKISRVYRLFINWHNLSINGPKSLT